MTQSVIQTISLAVVLCLLVRHMIYYYRNPLK